MLDYTINTEFLRQEVQLRLAAVMLICIAILASCPAGYAAEPAVAQRLSDSPDLITFLSQGWGELGIDCAAHATQPPLPLRIADATYAKGLGTHAPGEMLIDLDGGYTAFKASVGLQWQDSEEGSVVFKVLVDGKELFNSGTMRKHDPAKSVNVSLKDADELRLVVNDAGDGMTCDCADWADAALLPNPSAAKPTPEQGVDIARFAKVRTWDPARMDRSAQQPRRAVQGRGVVPRQGTAAVKWRLHLTQI